MRKTAKRKIKRRKRLPIGDMRSSADKLGSYTGEPTDGDYSPTQDADDL